MSVELIYWDSAVFLAYFQEERGRVELCRGTLERAGVGDVCIITSALTIAECLWLRNAPPVPKDRADTVRRFFRRSFLRVRNVTRRTSELAQDLVWDHQIRPKDAIHVATAIEARVAILETFDEPLIGKSGSIAELPIIIRMPIGPDQRSLPL
jgi:predicted nucleic acid-binding protein